MKTEERKAAFVYLKLSEYTQLHELFQQTAHRAFSDFLRTLIMRKPLVKKFRNQSLDDILQMLITIKTDMEGIRRTLTASVERLKALPQSTSLEMAVQLLTEEELRVNEQILLIKQILINIYDKCSQQGNHMPE